MFNYSESRTCFVLWELLEGTCVLLGCQNYIIGAKTAVETASTAAVAVGAGARARAGAGAGAVVVAGAGARAGAGAGT